MPWRRIVRMLSYKAVKKWRWIVQKKTIHEWTYYMRYVYIYGIRCVCVYIYIMYITCLYRIRYMYIYIHIIYIIHIHTWGKSCRNTRSSEDQTQNPYVSCQEYPWKGKNLHTQKSIYPGTKNKNRQKRGNNQPTNSGWLSSLMWNLFINPEYQTMVKTVVDVMTYTANQPRGRQTVWQYA
jgi:hypothetical protein